MARRTVGSMSCGAMGWTPARNAHWSGCGRSALSTKTLQPLSRGCFCRGRAIKLPKPPLGIASWLVVDAGQIGRIRRLHSRKNKSEREISRITGLSRNTVSKWLHGQVDGPPKYRRGEQPGKLVFFGPRFYTRDQSGKRLGLPGS